MQRISPYHVGGSSVINSLEDCVKSQACPVVMITAVQLPMMQPCDLCVGVGVPLSQHLGLMPEWSTLHAVTVCVVGV